MKRKYLIWTLTGLGLLGIAVFAMSRYSALAQDPNGALPNNSNGDVRYLAPGLPFQNNVAQPATPPVPAPAPNRIIYRNPGGPALAPNLIQPSVSPTFLSPGSHQDEMRVQQLLREYQSSKEDAKRKELVDQITKTVAHQFEEKQLVRERELKELEERVKELRSTHAKRESLKEKIIADRVQQLINNVDGLGWGYEPNNVMVPAGASPLLFQATPGQAKAVSPRSLPWDAPPVGMLPATTSPSQQPTVYGTSTVYGTFGTADTSPAVDTISPVESLPASTSAEPVIVETTKADGGR